jgi:hypothetical protein
MNHISPLRQAVFFVILIALLVTTIYGAQTIRDKDFYNKTGFFEIRTSPYGLYLTVPDSGVFYNFSAYDTFTRRPDMQTNLLVWEDSITSEESEIAENYLKKPIQIYNTILSYAGRTNPTATFEKGGKRAVYTSETIDNKIIVRMVENRILPVTQADTLFISLSINESDFIFDERGNEYNNRSANDIRNFNTIYPFRLNSINKTIAQQEEMRLTGVRYLFITNQKYNGVLRIPVQTPYYTLDTISFQYGLLQYRITDKNVPTVIVEVFDNIEEATKNI